MDLDIYLYSSVEFTPKDNTDAIVLWKLVKQIGKTILLNSFFNYLLRIKIEEDFRYTIIHETFGTSQSVSQTSEVTIYNIIRMNDLPPIQIIDTPGYGDTRRIKEDMKITSKIELKNKYYNVCFFMPSA